MPSEDRLALWGEPHRLPIHGAVLGRTPRVGGSMVVAALATQEPGLAFVGTATLLVFFVQHRRKRWWFDGKTIHLREGWWSLSERSLGVDRIQQVDLREQLVARMLGLALVVVESASGATGADIEIVLTSDEARMLREAVLRARQSPEPAPGPAPASEADRPPVAALGAADLVLAGITGTETIAAVAGTLAVLGPLWASAPEQWGEDVVDAVGLTAVVALAVLGILAVAAVGGIVRSVLAYGEFRLDVEGDEIRMRRGLLDRREESTPVRRVQVITTTATPIQRAIGRVAVQLRSAGRAGQDGADRLRIPLWPAAEAAALTQRLVPDIGSALGSPLVPAPEAARRRALVRGALVGGAVGPAAGSAVGAAASVPAGAAAAALLVVVGALIGLAAFQALGIALTDHAFVSRRDPVVRRTDAVPVVKVQSTRVRSSPFQRRWGLSTLHVDVAGGPSVKAPDRTREEAMAVSASLIR